MTYTVIIPGRLDNMNDYTSAQRTNRYKGASMKANNQKICEVAIRHQLKGVHLKRVKLKYTFFEKNQKRDLDNISGFAHKVFQDALVSVGVLKDDGWDQITGYEDAFAVDKNNPHIVVEIIEVEGCINEKH